MARVAHGSPAARRYVPSQNVVSREIAGEVLLVPIHRHGDEVAAIYVLNEVATRVWELMDGSRPIGEIVSSIVDEFEVTSSEATRDIETLTEELVEFGLLMEAGG